MLTDAPLNLSVNVTVWPGFRVAGGVIPEALNREPATDIAEIATGAVPVELRVTDWVADCCVCRLPKLTVVELTARVGIDAFSCTLNVAEAAPAVAVSVTVCAAVTAATVALKLALVALGTTVTETGTVTAGLLLARVTAMPPESAAAVRVTVQASVPAPVIEALEQDTVLRASVVVGGGGATATALRLTITSPWDELLAIVRTPV